ncbi:MAG: LysR family transcriptional regulator [Deltaproteobacteria bacterium]|nr:LysR family transcriptional regulator [Deltaproteobacteria bacterium]MBM4322254.1 LysR family transcriptional regulator [Deltaproteobacteria bacterium]
MSKVEARELHIDFRHLETFCRVASLKSFSKAAEDLFLTQPTVSGHILTLEKTLSIRLFDRNGREVRLTKAGEIFYGFALKILTSRKELINALGEFSQGIRGELSLGASTIPGEYLLPKLMGDFKKGHPHFRISLKIADTKEIVQYVLEGTVEFGVTGAKLNHPSLHYEKYTEDEIIVVSSPNHFLSRKRRAKIEDLLKEPWIIREEGSGTQMAVERELRKRSRSLKQFHVVMEMGSTSSLKEAVKAGVGLAFISKRAAEEELNRKMLLKIDAEGLDAILRQIYIVSHRRRTLSPIGIAFLRFLRKNKE